MIERNTETCNRQCAPLPSNLLMSEYLGTRRQWCQWVGSWVQMAMCTKQLSHPDTESTPRMVKCPPMSGGLITRAFHVLQIAMNTTVYTNSCAHLVSQVSYSIFLKNSWKIGFYSIH